MVDNANHIRIEIERLVDDLISDGNTASAAIAILERELQALRVSFEQDPDPVDDPID